MHFLVCDKIRKLNHCVYTGHCNLSITNGSLHHTNQAVAAAVKYSCICRDRHPHPMPSAHITSSQPTARCRGIHCLATEEPSIKVSSPMAYNAYENICGLSPLQTACSHRISMLKPLLGSPSYNLYTHLSEDSKAVMPLQCCNTMIDNAHVRFSAQIHHNTSDCNSLPQDCFPELGCMFNWKLQFTVVWLSRWNLRGMMPGWGAGY